MIHPARSNGNNIKFYYDSYGDTIDWIDYINYRGSNYSKTISEINSQFDFYEKATDKLCDEKYGSKIKLSAKNCMIFLKKRCNIF